MGREVVWRCRRWDAWKCCKHVMRPKWILLPCRNVQFYNMDSLRTIHLEWKVFWSLVKPTIFYRGQTWGSKGFSGSPKSQPIRGNRTRIPFKDPMPGRLILVKGRLWGTFRCYKQKNIVKDRLPRDWQGNNCLNYSTTITVYNSGKLLLRKRVPFKPLISGVKCTILG